MLPAKLQSKTVPLAPYQTIAPPFSVAVLPVKLQPETLPSAPTQYIAPPSPFAFPFLKVKPIIFVNDAVTLHILLWLSASNITSPSPYFMKFNLLAIVRFRLSFPVYVPDAIITVSPF